MSKLIWAAGILILLISMQIAAERSEQYWEEVGPNMDQAMNPNKYDIIP
jgi:hypothetical protein